MVFGSVGDAMRSVAMQYDAMSYHATPWDWMEFDGMRSDAMRRDAMGLDFFNDGWDGMASGMDFMRWELNRRDAAPYLATGGWGWIWIWYLAADGWGWIFSTMGGMGLAVVIVG